MTAHDASTGRERSGDSANAPEAKSSKRRLFVLIGLLALALFALWNDYMVAGPAVEHAYKRIEVVNGEINGAAEHRRMTSVDVQKELARSPSETFIKGQYTVEAYRWLGIMPIEIRGLREGESPGIGLKSFAYYAVYLQDGPDLAFMTHFKGELDADYFAETPSVATTNDSVPSEAGMPDMGMGMMSGGGPGGGGSGGFDLEAIFAERDADSDGKLAGDEISERLRARLDTVDADGDGAVSKEEFIAGMAQRGGRGGPGAGRPGGEGSDGEGAERRQRPPLEEADDAPATDSKEPVADPTPETPASEAAPEADSETVKGE